SPGLIRTNIGRSIGQKMDYDLYATHSLMKRVGDPVEIANLVSFLVSDDAANITGSIIVSDTGAMVK
ncbi:SDR family oxidoreductase, partial [Acinetobacter ursingii]|uniref:SDR family oxidoreductase n=1 Tax=Acinetobacter ursingii TaxID=108980 RepID=UPI00124FA71A